MDSSGTHIGILGLAKKGEHISPRPSPPNVMYTDFHAHSIKPIDKGSVHRICSGQVVLTLAVAVKELVENSLDAGSTYIEIKLKDYGSSVIEVSDNGCGVAPCGFSGLTKKHHTSKIEKFGDLVGIKTFGFRGEALSSLCALSDLTVVTKHQKQSVGSKLVYNNEGDLVSEVSMARNVGTTIILENIFFTLPVRHKEFHRNLKKEFNKMVQFLYNYCLICNNVRISCTNVCDGNKKSIALCTDAKSSMKERISSLFGVKQVSSLVEIKPRNACDYQLSEFNLSDPTDQSDGQFFHMEGFVSSCAHGLGRSSADRQFYYINSRPCDPVKIARVVNEVYHQYNRHQFPMIVLNIVMDDKDVDINVTPDKRQILVNREKLLLKILQNTLVSLYENIPSTFDVNLQPLGNRWKANSEDLPSSLGSKRKCKLSERFSRNPQVFPNTGLKRTIASMTDEKNDTKKQPKLHDFAFSSLKNSGHYTETNGSYRDSNGYHSKSSGYTHGGRLEENETLNDLSSVDEGVINDSKLGADYKECLDLATNDDSASVIREDVLDMNTNYLLAACINQINSDANNGDCDAREDSKDEVRWDTIKYPTSKASSVEKDPSKSKTFKLENFSRRKCVKSEANPKHCKIQHRTNDFIDNILMRKKPKVIDEDAPFGALPNDGNAGCDESGVLPNNDNAELKPDSCVVVIEETDGHRMVPDGVNSVLVPFSLTELKERLKAKKRRRQNLRPSGRKFCSGILPSENDSAEAELKKEISKEMFKKMEILGQFNLGFIITRLTSDLFIIDQHASDEKFNFEYLQKNAIIEAQKLIIPQKLQLTAVNESILMENLKVFAENGFEIKIDDDEDVGNRVILVSIPHYQGWEFGKEDIEEMIFMLSDYPATHCRPSRIHSMFASKACRKSVMIGTPLDKRQMRTLVDHMADIEHPWSCPHGRPTMRHLINLKLINSSL